VHSGKIALFGETMITLRCTKKLQKHLGVKPELDDVEPTSALGDWYGNLVDMPAGPPLILCTNERSLLSVVLGHDADVVKELWRRVTGLLRRLDFPKEAVERETFHLQQIRIGNTRNRRVLGSMTDAVVQLEHKLHESRGTVDQAEDYLAENPYSMLEHKLPSQMALELLGAPPRPAPRPSRPVAAEAEPDVMSALDLLSQVLDAPPAKGERIAPAQTVPIFLSARDRELIIKHTFVGPEIIEPLERAPLDAGVLAVGITLGELDDLLGNIAATANHCGSQNLQRELDDLYGRLHRVEESHDDGHRGDEDE